MDRNFRLTYREFGQVVDQLAKAIWPWAWNRGKGAVWANNVPYWVALHFATAKIGAILLTVNPITEGLNWITSSGSPKRKTSS